VLKGLFHEWPFLSDKKLKFLNSINTVSFNRFNVPKFIVFAVAFFTLAVLPCLYLFPDFNPYDEKRLMQVGLLLAVGLLFVGSRLIASLQDGEKDNNAPGRSMLRPPGFNKISQGGITLFIIFGVVSTWVNGYWLFGLQLLSLYVLLLVFFLYGAACYKQNPGRFNKAIYILAAGYAGLYALKFGISYGLFLWGNYPLWPGPFQVSTLYGWSNIRFFSQVQTWTLPLLVSLSLSIKNRSLLLSRIVLGLAAFWWCLIFAGGAQGSMVALICSSLLILVLFGRKSKAWVMAMALSALVGLVAYFLLFYLPGGGEAGATVLDNSTKGRFLKWSVISKEILLQPFLGFGPLSLASAHNLPSMAHPHNSILQLAYEFGIPATVIAVSLIGWGVVRWLSWNRQLFKQQKELVVRNYLQIGLSVSLCAGLAHSLVSGVMVMPLSQLWFCIIAAWAWGIYHHERKKNRVSKKISGRSMKRPQTASVRKIVPFAIKGVVLAAIIFMSYSMIQDVSNLKKYRQEYIENTPYLGYPPRFWQQGKIWVE
jgi:O-antigen ligase